MNEELNRVRGRVSYLIESCENGFVRIPRSLLIELRDALPDGGKGDEHDSRMWDAGYSAGIDFERRRNALLADGGKGEAVYQYKVRDLSGWHDCDAGAYERITTNIPEHWKRARYSRPASRVRTFIAWLTCRATRNNAHRDDASRACEMGRPNMSRRCRGVEMSMRTYA